MLRRLQALILVTVLVVAAFSTGQLFLFYLLYLGILVVGGSYVLVRLGLNGSRGRLRGQPAPRPRRRPDARDLHAPQRQPASRSRGWRSTTRRRCPAACPAAPITLGCRGGALVAHPDAPHPARAFPHRAVAHPDRRPVRLLRGRGDGRAGRQRRRLPAARAAADVEAARGEPRGQPRLAGTDAPDHAAGNDASGPTPPATA